MCLARRIFTAHFHEVFQIGALENDFSETYLAHYPTFTKVVLKKHSSLMLDRVLNTPLTVTTNGSFPPLIFSERESYPCKEVMKIMLATIDSISPTFYGSV